MRGAEPTALTTVKVNNEVAFCKVYSLKEKEEIEKILLKNRISYYVRWEEQSLFKRLFGGEAKEKNIFVICINEASVADARELLAEMQNVKFLLPES